MDPKPIEKELLLQEDETANAPRQRAQRVRDFPLDFSWWVGDPYVRALSRDERAGLLDAMCYSLKTAQPGVMSEEQLRIWAGYSPEEWTAHGTHFLPLFRVRPNGSWTMPVLRTVFLAQRRRLRRARKAALEANRKRWRDNTKRAVGTPVGYKSDAKRGVKGIRPESLSTQESKTDMNAVPAVGVSSPGGSPPRENLLAPERLDGLVQGVMAGLVRGGAGS